MNTVEQGAIACEKQQPDSNGTVDVEKGRGKELDFCSTGTSNNGLWPMGSFEKLTDSFARRLQG